MNDDGYLSRNRPYLDAMQRQRRARMVRVDYMPSKAARDAIEAMRARSRPGSVSATNSAVIDAIVGEWARLTGINYSDLSKPKTSAGQPVLSDQYARARMTSDGLAKGHTHGGPSPMEPKLFTTSARTNKSGSLPAGADQARVICGANRRRDGQPCQGLSVPGKRRCKWHGGCSTGPRTEVGRGRALANLKQFQSQATLGASASEAGDNRP